MNINQIIQVNVNTSNASAQLENLGLALIVGDSSSFPASFTDAQRVKAYNSLSAMISDGFTSGTAFYNLCQTAFANGLNQILVGKKISSDTSYVEAIQAISLINNNFYAVLADASVDSDILAIAQYIETNQNIFLACTADTSVLDSASTVDIASVLKANSITRTQLFYDPGLTLSAAVCGAVLSTQIGQDRVAYLSNLSNVTPVILNTTQVNTLNLKHCSFYITIAAINLVISNTSSIFTQISSVRDIDWFKNTIQTTILSYLANNKIPYTDSGISIVENIIMQVIVTAGNYGVISYATINEIANQLGILPTQVQGYVSALGCAIVMPTLAQISQVNISQGVLPGINIVVLYSGAILEININVAI